MNLSPYVESIHRQLEASAEAGDEDARLLLERLLVALDASIRLALQDALAAAAEEITVELAPGSVELRLRGRDPEFVVTPPPPDPSAEEGEEGLEDDAWPEVVRTPQDDEGAVSRINLRLPEQLKSRIDRTASDEGMSVNSWLVRAASAALDRPGPPRRRERRTGYGAQRYTGWAR
jgi:Arc-like DNA binding dprotein